MSLASIIAGAVATAKNVTASLQPTVKFEPWMSQTGHGTVSYGAPQNLRALLERKTKPIKTTSGQLVMSNATVTLLELPTPQQFVADRVEPVDPRDRFTFPDGFTGPIVAVNGMTNPETGQPFLLEIYLG